MNKRLLGNRKHRRPRPRMTRFGAEIVRRMREVAAIERGEFQPARVSTYAVDGDSVRLVSIIDKTHRTRGPTG